MALDLEVLDQRIVGVLIEKQLSVPDTYPLTSNALLAGCTQKSNREPRLEVADWELEGALRGLMDRGWVVRVEREAGRAHRYAHQAHEQLGVEPPDLALLAELLCRGPQTATQLKTRAARMAPVGGPAEVEARLAALADRPVPYVVKLPRRPREHMPRWAHLLDGLDPEAGRARVHPAAGGAPGEPGAPARPAASVPPAAADRIAALEAALAALAERVARLEDERG